MPPLLVFWVDGVVPLRIEFVLSFPFPSIMNFFFLAFYSYIRVKIRHGLGTITETEVEADGDLQESAVSPSP